VNEKDKTQQAASGQQSDLSRPLGKAMSFSFGVRRYGAPRRLFVPQESSSAPAFLPPLERPNAILRVLSDSG